jgi:hypothetical protein
VTHDTSLVAVHPQSRAADTVSVARASVGESVSGIPEIVAWHRTASGAASCSVIAVAPPHPGAASSAHEMLMEENRVETCELPWGLGSTARVDARRSPLTRR